MKFQKKKSISKKVIGKIEPSKLTKKEQGQIEYLKWIFMGIFSILVFVILDALAVKFFGFSGFVQTYQAK